MSEVPNEITVPLEMGMLVKINTSNGFVTVAQMTQTEKGIEVEPRDDYHKMSEIYHYRMLYNAHAANEWAKHGTYPVVKSWKHSDGELCFGGGWFVVVVELPTGQVSNHYRELYWELFKVPEVELAPEYDGHTPEEAAKRLFEALEWETIQ